MNVDNGHLKVNEYAATASPVLPETVEHPRGMECSLGRTHRGVCVVKATTDRRNAEADRNSRIKVQVSKDIAKARRQPTARRGKVAVSDPRTCVQWELHTGSGRCACGWAA
jgi:hypothetical protein